MTANLFFSQPMALVAPAVAAGGRSSGVGTHQRAGNKISGHSAGHGQENFLHTLSRACREQPGSKSFSEEGTISCVASPVEESKKTRAADEAAMADNESPGAKIEQETVESEKTSADVKAEDIAPIDFTVLLKTIEALSVQVSAGDSSLHPDADESPVNLAALKAFLAGIGQSDVDPSSEMKSVLAKLKQLVENAQTALSSSDGEAAPADLLSDSEKTFLADLSRLVAMVSSSEARGEDATDRNHSDKSRSDDAPPEAMTKIIQMVTTLVDTFRETNGSAAAEANASPAAETSGSPVMGTPENSSQTDTGSQTHPIKPLGPYPTEASQNVEDPTQPAKSDDSRAVNAEAQNTLDNNTKSRMMSRDAFSSRIAASIQHAKSGGDQPTVDGASNLSAAAPTVKSSDAASLSNPTNTGMHSVGESAAENPTNGEASPAGKMIQNAQAGKESALKIDAGLNGETGLKPTKIDSGSADSGLANFQNQTLDKAADTAAISRQSEVGQNSLHTETLDQIVKRAVIQVHNGQHEARIDLKPEFLGHIRMQVTTENQHVTVKILTELPIAKEIIEAHMHQLKADLQQQGLNMDKLEVSISPESNKQRNLRQESGRGKSRVRNVEIDGPQGPETPAQGPDRNAGPRTADSSTVDFFA